LPHLSGIRTRSGEKKDITEWHRIEAWGKQGEVIAQYHVKGDLIHIEGKLIYDQWEKDGVKQTTAKIRVNEFVFIKARADQPQATPKPQPAPAVANGQDSEDDDLPF
jgi:single-strand DNA-binding protein